MNAAVSKDIADAMTKCMSNVEAVGRLAHVSSPFAIYRFLPQVLQYVSCMREALSVMHRGEERGRKMLLSHVSRIAELHEALFVSSKRDKEKKYMTGQENKRSWTEHCYPKACAEQSMHHTFLGILCLIR